MCSRFLPPKPGAGEATALETVMVIRPLNLPLLSHSAVRVGAVEEGVLIESVGGADERARPFRRGGQKGSCLEHIGGGTSSSESGTRFVDAVSLIERRGGSRLTMSGLRSCVAID